MVYREEQGSFRSDTMAQRCKVLKSRWKEEEGTKYKLPRKKERSLLTFRADPVCWKGERLRDAQTPESTSTTQVGRS